MARELRRLAIALVEEVNERRTLTVERRMLRDRANPFEISEHDFMKYFHVPKVVAHYLCDELDPVLARKQRRGLAVHTQVLVTLRFMAEGGYQKGVGQDMLLSVSQPTVSNCIQRVTQAIISNLLGKWITFPKTPGELMEIGERFRGTTKFPGVVGAIDCTHIALVTPLVNEEGYRNHKGFHSLNVQMICDDQMRVLNIRSFPGSVHDQFVWSYSSARRIMREAHDRQIGLFYLIGDSGYALEPWLLTPLPHAPEGSPEYRYTLAHCRARSVVERLFGVLKGRWRCLLKDRVLHYQPKQASAIVASCAVLHNIMVHYRVPLPDIDVDENAIVQGEAVQAMSDILQLARRIQHNIIQQHFA